MSAEHGRVKDPLPTRPPRPHPQGVSLPPLPRATRSRRRILAVRGWMVAASVAAAVAVSACTPPEGPAGTVVDRDRTYWSATKQWTYKLTVRKADGGRSTFKVLRSGYRSCSIGDAYPACTS